MGGLQRLVGPWFECRHGIPEFVYRSTKPGSLTRQRTVHTWFNWNEESRTLQYKENEATYWVITRWRSRDCWDIEKWMTKKLTKDENSGHYVDGKKWYIDDIAYWKDGQNEPT